jgi:DNA-binding MarR family transcriptional regulator
MKVQPDKDARETASDPGLAESVQAAMAAAGAFVAIVIAAGERLEVPLTTRQLRCLLIIARRGPLNLVALADSMRIHPSSATRLCDGLVEARLIRRGQAERDRRNLELTVTARGQRIIDRLVAERQRVLSEVIAAMPPEERAQLATALTAFAVAAGEIDSTGVWPVEPSIGHQRVTGKVERSSARKGQS